MKTQSLKKALSVGLTVALMGGMLAGCSLESKSSAQEENTAEEKFDLEGKKAGVILPSFTGEFLTLVGSQIKTGLEDLGMEVELVSSDNDSAKELLLLENYAGMQMDVIAIMPQGATAGEIGNTYKRLSANGGPRIISFGSKVEDESCYAQILLDNTSVGETTAQTAAEWIDETFPDAAPGSVEVALLTTESSVESKAHSEGMRKIEEYTDKAKIVEVYEMGFSDQLSKAQEYADMMISTHPDVKVVLTYSAVQALAVNEVVMRSPSIDVETFGIFGSDWSEEIADQIVLSENNESAVRATNVYGGEDGSTATPIIQAAKGELPLDENGIYYYENISVTPENVDEIRSVME